MVPLTDPTPRPVAIGYVSSPDPAALDAQREAVTAHARAEGYALAHILADRLDGYTISQIVDVARSHDARLVLLPAETTLASAHQRLTRELESHGAACVVIGDTGTTAVDSETGTKPPRLTGVLQRHPAQHAGTKQ